MHEITVTDVTHHTEKLFSILTTRPDTFKFVNGEFVMIGLPTDEGKPLLRAYSIVSTQWDEHLEFYSIKVPDGPLTSKLQHVKPGDKMVMGRKATGSLLVDAVYSKPNLVLLSTGTGVAPFVPIVQDPWSYDRFERVYLFHTVRHSKELAFEKKFADMVDMYPNFKYISTVTEEPRYQYRQGRFWQHLEEFLPNGFQKDRDSVMVCGSPELNTYCRDYFGELGWVESSPTGIPGDFALERAFAD